MLLFVSLALPTPYRGSTKGQSPAINEDWIYQISQQDSAAFSLFYEQTKSAVYAFALSMLKNQEDALDVMQETYLKIRAAAHLYQPMGKPMAWVYTITRNLCLMHLRSHSRYQELPEEPELAPDALHFVADPDDRLVLTAVLNILSLQERSIVLLHAVSGMKHQEIASLLSIGLSTELSKYHRALKKLKKALREGGYPHE